MRKCDGQDKLRNENIRTELNAIQSVTKILKLKIKLDIPCTLNA
jgi:hypothetical protein